MHGDRPPCDPILIEVAVDTGESKLETAELCARYRKLYMPVVCDALYQLGLPEPVLPNYLRPLLPEQRMVGVAYTLRGQALPNLPWEEGVARMRSYLEMFERLTPDTVLVHVTHDGSHVGHFGELTANAARRRGCVGVVLDGNLRDIEGLREIGFQAFYRDLSPLNGIGRWEMVVDQEPVTIGEVTVNPGDLVHAEFDGIVVVPRAEAEQVLLKAEEIASAEGRVRADMRAGATPLEGLQRHGHI